jgi:signal transduction histidine kinase
VRRLPPSLVDAAIACVLVGWGLLELLGTGAWGSGPHVVQVVGVVVACGSVAARRRLPLAAAGAFAVGELAMILAGYPPEILAVALAGMVLAYSLAAQLDGAALLTGVAILAGTVLAKDVDDPKLGVTDIVIDLVFLAMPLLVGRVVRRRERTADHIARVADDRTRDAIERERQRIARELHDVIAHGMSVMVVQADAARHGLRPEDDDTREALSAIEHTGRESLREMRRLLGLLRHQTPDGDGAVAPQGGMTSLDGLIDSVRRAGLPVGLTIEGQARPLPPGIDLAAYRIVQEALTNSLRHAGPAHAHVAIDYRPRELALRIEDDGRGSPNGTAGSGSGLIGMRERVRFYGGTFDAGRHDGGFLVTATLPLETPR